MPQQPSSKGNPFQDYISVAEEWRDVPGYAGLYQVSSLANLRHLGGRSGAIKERLLRPQLRKGAAYLTTVLYDRCKAKSFSVHCLVALAFIGERPEGYEVNHKDLNKLNNKPSNLEYVTPKQNRRHAVENGAFRLRRASAHRGDTHRWSKIKEADMPMVLRLLKQGDSLASIGRIFGVTRQAIWNIKHGLNRRPFDREELINGNASTEAV